MEIKALLLTVLLGFSVNVLAVEPTYNPISLEKKQFSNKETQAICDDWNYFFEFMLKQKDSFQNSELEFLKTHKDTIKSKQDKEFLKFRLSNLIQFKNALNELVLRTPEVQELKFIHLKTADNQIQFAQKLIELGYEQSKANPDVQALDKQFTMLTQEFHIKLNSILVKFH